MSKPREKSTDRRLFGTPILDFIDSKHPLCILSQKLDWKSLESHFDRLYSPGRGQPPLSVRLVLGLHILKYLDNLSDETLVFKFIENPYYQHFCGNIYFEHSLPCDPSSMTRWRKRIGYKGFEKLLKETIDLAKRENLAKPKEFDKIYVDTTVQEKNIAFPTDGRLYFKGIRLLNKCADRAGIKAKQSYKFTSKRLLLQYSRYQFAKQFRRAKKCLKKLKTAFGRLIRDIQRKVIEQGVESRRLTDLLALSMRIFNQKRSSKNKIYSYHAPETKCIAKGKAHKRYEFGNKVSIASTAKSGWVVGMESFSENIFDGKTLADSLVQVKTVLGSSPGFAYVDRGYRGYTGTFMETQIYHQGQRRGLSKSTRNWLRKRSKIEPLIGHLKVDHRMGRNFLLGTLGDKINAILAGCAFNLRKALRLFASIRLFFFQILIKSLFFEKNKRFTLSSR